MVVNSAFTSLIAMNNENEELTFIASKIDAGSSCTPIIFVINLDRILLSISRHPATMDGTKN